LVILAGLSVTGYITQGQLSAEKWTGLATWIYAVLTLGILIVLIYAAVAPLRLQAKAREDEAKAREEEAKTRRAEYMVHLGERWTSPLLMESRKRTNELGEGLSAKLLEPNVEQKEEFYYLVAVAIFFEDLGNAVNKEWVRLEEAYDFFGPSIKLYYKLYASYIEKVQEKDENILKYFKLLAERIIQLEKSQSTKQQK